MTIVMPVNKG